MNNWRKVDDYPRINGTTPSEWAWEFLRRNPGYIKDWETFRSSIGKYADRYSTLTPKEMSAFLRDASYQHVHETGIPTPLAYYFGRKWGLMRIVDPETPYERLTHTWINTAGSLLYPGPWFNFNDPFYVTVAIDMRLPLDAQAASMRAHCIAIQNEMIQAGEVQPMKEKRKNFRQYAMFLRVLDGHAASAHLSELAKVLLPSVRNTAASDYSGNRRIRYYFDAATALSRDGYHRLLRTSEK